MTPWTRLEVATFTIAAIFLACAHGLKIDLSRLALNRPSFLTAAKRSSSCEGGNPCDMSKPFLCRGQLICIALKFVCDGSWDCPDGFDEEPGVCNAAARPSYDDLLYFLEAEKTWMIPQLFNGAEPQMVAHALSVASDMHDLSQSIGMTDENVRKLTKAFQAAMEGDERPLLDMGMPSSAWHEVQYVLQKIYDSGFNV